LFFAVIACDNGETHTHEWEWLETTPPTLEAEGEATETCKTCKATRDTRPIAKLELETKTYPITLKDGALTFTVAYKALPTDEEPAYLAYIKERLEAIADSTVSTNEAAVNYLLGKGNSFTITIQYGETSFTGINWKTAEQSFEIHNDWITTGTDLSLGMLRAAFNSVELPTQTYTITLKDGALTFTVAYKALPADEEPAYLAYLQTRLGVVANSTTPANEEAVEHLLSKGNSFTIEIEYTGSSYEGLIWNTATKKFNLHND
jgi:hypothetical protein